MENYTGVHLTMYKPHLAVLSLQVRSPAHTSPQNTFVWVHLFLSYWVGKS